MTLYLYKIGTAKPVLTVENAQSYTADSVMAADGTVYGPLGGGLRTVLRTGMYRDPAGGLPGGTSHAGDPSGGVGGTGGGTDVRR